MTRVLIATDSGRKFEEAVSALRHDEVEAVRVGSGSAALRRLGPEEFDCVVSAACLPDMDGLQFLERARSTSPSVPTVLVVGEEDVALLNRARTVGVDDVIAEGPGMAEYLVAAVKSNMLDGRLEQQRRLGTEVHEVISQVALAAATASASGEIKRTVCRELAGSELYTLAWVSRYDPEADRLVPEEAAGIDVAHLRPGDRPEGIRLDSGALVTERPGSEEGVELSVPLGHEGSLFAVLTLTTDRSVDSIEREALAELGATLGALLHGERLSPEIHPQVEEFGTIVSHELRNQLNIAHGYLAQAERGDPEAFDLLEGVLDRIETIADEVATIASGRVKPEDIEPVDLGELAESAWEHVGPSAEDTELTVEDSDTVCMHPGLLRHTFENLFQNSVTHAGDFFRGEEDPEDDLEIRVGTLENGFYVEDSGRGIPESDRERVFRWGYTTHPDGDGIGLPLIKRFIDAHGWDVTVSESPEGGARFEIRFDRDAEHAEHAEV